MRLPPGVHAEGSCREFVLHAAMPPKSWIRLPSFFASAVPQGEPLGLWLQHAGCSTLATGAEVAVVAPGEVFMTRGWGEVARVCGTRGALAIHLEYDGASVMSFKVFNAEGRRLECCLGEAVGTPLRRHKGRQITPSAAPQVTEAPEDPVTPPGSS